MTQIRGRSIRGVLRFVKQADHPGGIASVLGTLPASVRRSFKKPIRGFSWYPYEVYTALLDAVDRTIGDGERTLMRSVGRFGLETDAGSTLKILRVFSSVDALVHRGFASWGPYLWRHHCDQGAVILLDSGPGTATMGIEDFPDVSAAHCQVNLGYLEGMGHAVGAHEIRMTKTECVHRGDPRCAYRGSWS